MLSSTWATTMMRMSAVRGHGGSVCCWCDDRLVGESEGEELCSAVMVLEVVLTYAFLLILRDRWDGPFILSDKGSELVGRSDCYPTSYIREEDMKMQKLLELSFCLWQYRLLHHKRKSVLWFLRSQRRLTAH